MIYRKLIPILLVLTTLATASLACKLFDGGSQPEPIPVSTQAAGQLEENIEQAAQALQNNQPFSLAISETQLTSAVNLRLQAMGETRLKNLQIFLRDGQIQASGDAVSNGVELPVNLAVKVFLSPAGQPDYEIVTATAGPFPLPDSVLNQLTAQLDQLILTQLSAEASNIVLDSINIQAGVMTITGHTP